MIVIFDEGRLRRDVMLEVSGVPMILDRLEIRATFALLKNHLPWHSIELIYIVFILVPIFVLRR